jgi:hypothetical protein
VDSRHCGLGPQGAIGRVSMGALTVKYSFFEWQLPGMPILSENGDNGHDTAVQRLECRQGILHARPKTARRVPGASPSRGGTSAHHLSWPPAGCITTCRSSRLINQHVDRVPLCVSHAGMAFASDREAVPQCVQLGSWQRLAPAPAYLTRTAAKRPGASFV